jgi:hypothetical protein
VPLNSHLTDNLKKFDNRFSRIKLQVDFQSTMMELNCAIESTGLPADDIVVGRRDRILAQLKRLSQGRWVPCRGQSKAKWLRI